jgi:precorrin-8X/cobalt-precorrin-8 methylmutase
VSRATGRRAVHPIEAESYRILRGLVDLSGLGPLSRAVAERVVHASADPSWAADLLLDEQALAQGLAALRAGAPVVVDARMVAAAVTSRPTLCALDLAPGRGAAGEPPGGRPEAWPQAAGRPSGGQDEGPPPGPGDAGAGPPLAWPDGGDPGPVRVDAGRQLAEDGPVGPETRSAAGVRAAFERVGPGAVWVVGCAPTALDALLRLPAAPALVVGLPVGFVGAVEAKRALAASGLPALTNRGAKGGSAVAAAALNALLYQQEPA